jgi:broad specificity phosphatase PhoE
LTELLLVRHGESTWNQTGRYQGRIDTELSDLGQAQVEKLGEYLKSTPLDAIYSSPLRRAFHTALAISLPRGGDVVVDEDLTEIDHGAWNGLLREEVEKRYGPLLQQWMETPSQVKMPGGESLEEVCTRAHRALSAITEAHPEGRVGLCSHDAVIKSIIASTAGMSLDKFWSFRLDNASISVIFLGEPFPRLIRLNDTCHLGELRSNLGEQAL